MLVCDRENRRLCHFDFDGKFVSSITQHLRRPCQVSFHGDCAVVSELEGRVTILDRDNAPVAFLGDNPQKEQWANYQLPPGDICAGILQRRTRMLYRPAGQYLYLGLESHWARDQAGQETVVIRERKILFGCDTLHLRLKFFRCIHSALHQQIENLIRS